MGLSEHREPKSVILPIFRHTHIKISIANQSCDTLPPRRTRCCQCGFPSLLLSRNPERNILEHQEEWNGIGPRLHAWPTSLRGESRTVVAAITEQIFHAAFGPSVVQDLLGQSSSSNALLRLFWPHLPKVR